MPLRYLYTQFRGAEELVAYYRCADIALLTPLRDGMNLVARNSWPRQVDNDGVLILSEFAGAAEEHDRGAAGESVRHQPDCRWSEMRG